jgi:SAM-dependent methyltransferase
MVPYNKVIDIADFRDDELLPFIKEILFDEQIKFGLAEPIVVPDSKVWECGMMLRTFSDNGVLRAGATFAGVGAGIEQTTFALAARECVVFPSDRYLDVTSWSDVAPAGMMINPAQYSNFKYPRGNIIPVHADCRRANLPSNFFDGVYSARSIEHVGSLDGVAAAAEEIGRILKPGGIACLATEFRLIGPNDRRWFDDGRILFTADLIKKYIIEPSGLELIDEPNFSPSPATFDNRTVLLEFLKKEKSIVSIDDKKNSSPNLTVFHEGFLFCSIHLALRKPGRPAIALSRYAEAFSGEVNANLIKSAAVFSQQIVEWARVINVGEPVLRSYGFVARIRILKLFISGRIAGQAIREFLKKFPILHQLARSLFLRCRRIRAGFI